MKVNSDFQSMVLNWLAVGSPREEGCRLFKLLEVPNGAVLLRMLSKNDDLLKTTLIHHAGIKKIKKTSPVPEKPRPKRLRTEWPFLNDANCPRELKILVSDKITAYTKIREAHANLYDCKNGDEQLATVKMLVENYIENFLIYNELKHYQERGEILGEHPIFLEMKRLKKLQAIPALQWPILKKRLEHNIWRIQSEIAKNSKPHLLPERENKLKQKKRELEEINRLIDLYK